MKLITLLVIALLSLPAHAQGEGVRIVWHKTNSPWTECLAAYPNASRAIRASLMNSQGCFVVREGVCHVYAPDPEFNPSRAGSGSEATIWWILGHEVKHCFDGLFHR